MTRTTTGSGAGQSRIRLSLLGSFGLHVDDEPVELTMSAQRVLAFLALRRGAVTRAHVAGTLWGDTTDERAAANLRSALWRLRRPGVDLVSATNTHVRLLPSVEVDVHVVLGQAEQLLDEGRPFDAAGFDPMALAVDLLPDWYDDWVSLERERVRQTRLHALEALCERLIAAGRPSEAVRAAMVAVACEPLRESAQRVLVRAHVAEGNPSEAVRQYHAYREQLASALDLAPSPLMEEVVRGLRLH